MKKLISLFLALILLVSAVPAFAASLTPEDVIGSWIIYKEHIDGETIYPGKKYPTTVQFHADGTGKYTTVGYDETSTYNIKWAIKGNTVQMTFAKDGRPFLSVDRSGKYLVWTAIDINVKLYFKKTDSTTNKTVTKAILSSGVYQLNNSKKTAVFVSPSLFAKGTALKIPDTIKVNGITYKVTEIKAKACAGNPLPTTVTIGKNIKTIGANAFNGCRNLKKVTFRGTALTKVGSNAFKGIQSAVTVTCPKAKLSKYQKLLKKAGIPANTKFKAK